MALSPGAWLVVLNKNICPQCVEDLHKFLMPLPMEENADYLRGVADGIESVRRERTNNE